MGLPRLVGFFVAHNKEIGVTVSFKQFNLHPKVQSGVEAMGFETPTPIQQQAIPAVMEGHDVMGLAQTGTG
jgi:superfamily II DNA/RNA helicase